MPWTYHRGHRSAARGADVADREVARVPAVEPRASKGADASDQPQLNRVDPKRRRPSRRPNRPRGNSRALAVDEARVGPRRQRKRPLPAK